MKPWKRYLILGLAFLLLIKVFSCRLVDYDTFSIKKDCRPMASSTEITAPELEEFLPLWSAYVADGLNDMVSDKISLLSGDLESALPWQVNFWLHKRCWTADRFYYVEQRLRSIIHALYLREHTRAVKEILTERLEGETDEIKKTSYQNMIDMQDAIAVVEAVSDEELQAVRGRENEIEEVLNGKRRYESK